tara:strand:- start:5363 stop:6568 length:1206 start_codon:yes stop_codon:yes gene_type:complete
MEQLSFINKNFRDHFLSLLLVLVAFSFTYLPLLFLPISPLFYLAMSVIILFIFLLYDKKSFKSLFNDYSVFYWSAIFLSWYTLRLLFQPSTQFMVVNFEEVYLVTPVVIFLCTNFRYLRDSVSNVIFLLGGTYVFFGLITYLFLSSSSQFLGYNNNIFELLNLDFQFAIYQNVGFWISLFVIYMFNFIFINSKINRINNFLLLVLYAIFLFSIIMLLLAGARGAFIGCFLALVYLSRNIRDKKFIYSSAIGFALLLVFILLNQEFLNTINRLFALFGDNDESMRIYLFSQSIHLWSQDIYTILFGAGVKSFPIFIYQNDFGVYPHNVFLEILSELGIIGLIIFLKILFLFYRNRGSNELINAFSIFTIFVFCVTGSFDSFYKAFFFLCLGLKNFNNEILKT